MVDRVVAGAATRPEGTALPGVGARSGILPGLAGGLAMLAVLSAAAAWTGQGWLQPLRAIGAAAVGDGGGAVAAGLLLHALLSAAFGLAFAATLPGGFPTASATTVGAGYGLLVAGLMMSAVVPEAVRERMQPIGGAWVVGHAAYGLVLAAALARRRTGEREAPQR